MIHLVLSSFVADEFVAAAGSDFGSNQILIQPSVVSFVKLEKSQFDQVVLVDIGGSHIRVSHVVIGFHPL